MLLRHGWLAPLMKPPTISEDEEAEKAAEAGLESAVASAEPTPETADREVAEWVKSALERKRLGKMAFADKPALHAAPLDAVPGSPLLERDAIAAPVVPNPGVKLESPVLVNAKVESMDFASGVGGDGA